MPILKANQLSFKFPDENNWILKDINFEVSSKEILGIIGPNGGGKSTLLKIIVGLLKPTEGLLEFQNPSGLIGYVPQMININRYLPITVIEYLNLQARAINLLNAEAKIKETLKILNLENKKDYLFNSMSGGEKQRVLIAKSLLIAPELIVLDEPTTGLDSSGQDQLLNIIEEIRLQLKSAFIIVDHNLNQVLRKSDKILCLNRTSHWHDHKELLTKNVLEDIYHCELEHLLIHENDLIKGVDLHKNHQFCTHEHNDSNTIKHPFIKRDKR